MKKTLFSTLLLFFVISSNARTISVSDFGVSPNTFTDVTEGVRNAILECQKNPGSVLSFPAGRYDFWFDKASRREYFISNTTSETECPSKIKNIALLFENMNDVTVEGNGSLFVFHGKMITWAFDNCKNITVKNVTIDFERPSMTEITVKELYPDHMIGAIHPDSKYTIIDGKIRFYGEDWGMNDNYFSILTDTAAGTNVYSSWDQIRTGEATEMAPFLVKFRNDFGNVNYKEGQVLTTRAHIRDHVGVFVNRSKDIRLENVNLHYMHGLGVISQFSEDLFYDKVNITPTRGRTIAAFADGMHFSGCMGQIQITDCKFKGLHDDPINVHGTYLKIEKVDSSEKMTLRFMHSQTYGMQPFFENDTVAFIDTETLRKKGFAVVKSVERISDREVQVALKAPIPANILSGDCLENTTRTPSLRVSGCRMEMTNTRGLLITTPRKTIIENNYFYRIGMYAILIAADANSWYESGAVNDVTIRNNVFDGCGYNLYYDNNAYVIAVEPENRKFAPNDPVHRNIRIYGNTFKVYDDNLIMKARSTGNLIFENNKIERTDFMPDLKNRTKDAERSPSFKIEGCSGVKIEKNSYKIPVSDIRVVCSEMKKKDIKTEKDIKVIFK